MPTGVDPATVHPAVAGRQGEDVRSDLLVRFWPHRTGELEIVLERSKVAAMYGDAILGQARDVLDELGVRHGRLEIVDEGALPFVIAARIECAVRRSGVPSSGRVPLRRSVTCTASAKDRLRRSRLYLPGNDPKLCINAGLHGPDAVILDLEDSVHAAEKDAARLVVRNALRAVDFGAAELMVRINQLPAGLADLDDIVPEWPDLVLIPKVESADEVRAVDARIRELLGDEDRTVWLMPILESARGIEGALEIATACASVAALTIGLEDYTADLGVRKSREGTESLWARSRVVNAAHAARVQAIDSVYGDFADLDGLLEWGRRSRAMGFVGMGCIHPRQIRVVHDAFAPEPAEIERALLVVEAFEAAQREGLGVVSLGSKMIDPPVVNRAVKLVEQARAMGRIPPRSGSEERS